MPRYFFHPLNYWDISQQCTPNINWHQSYYNHGIASPYRLLGKVCCAAKSLRSLRIYILLRDRENGADFVFRYYIYIKHNFCVLFLIKSAPSRLSPIEALPQTPQGTLSLDPASPLTPGLSLRFISRSARCCLLLHI